MSRYFIEEHSLIEFEMGGEFAMNKIGFGRKKSLSAEGECRQ
jgi:hypothetical protein